MLLENVYGNSLFGYLCIFNILFSKTLSTLYFKKSEIVATGYKLFEVVLCFNNE